MKTGCIVALLFATIACFMLPLPTFDKHLYVTAITGQIDIPDYAVRNDFQRDLQTNHYHAYQQIPFYSIRALYIILAKTLSYFVPPLTALALISALCYLACGLILMRWTGNYLLSLLAMLSPPILYVGRSLTPDAMSALFVLAALFCYYKQRVSIACGILVISVWVRTDNIIVLGLFLLALTLTGELKLRYSALLLFVGIDSVLALNHFSGNYGYQLLFVNSFVHNVPNPGEITVHMTRAMYLHQLGICLRGMFAGSSVAIFVALGVIAWRLAPERRILLLVLSLSLVSKIALYPVTDERYFTPLYLVTAGLFFTSLPLSRALPCNSMFRYVLHQHRRSRFEQQPSS